MSPIPQYNTIFNHPRRFEDLEHRQHSLGEVWKQTPLSNWKNTF